MTKPTSGPWTLKKTRTSNGVFVYEALDIHADHGDEISHICEVGDWENKTAQANARLIAAAPEMLEALERIAECITECNCELKDCTHSDGLTLTSGACGAIPYIQKVIAKARGEK